MDERNGIYRVPPREQLALPGGAVPVFAARDAYVENYERIASDHLAHFEATGANPFMAEEFWLASERVTAGLLRRYGSAGARVLDVGCGMGRLLEPFAEFRRYGMDISAAYLDHAQRQGIEVCLARVEDMPYTDGLFDVVVCTDVLEHVLDLNSACAEMLRVTRDGGHLIVRVPYREDLSCYLSPELPYEFVHLRNFDEHGLTLLFEKICRCQVVEVLPGDVVLPWAAAKCRLPVRGMNFMFRVLAGAVRLLGARAHRAFLKWAFDPPVINVVVRVQRPASP
jgi:SAM-dependent methyltransferase